MASQDLFIGIDIGTSGARVIAVDSAGSLVAASTAAYPLMTPQPGWTEQHPHQWWEACRAALAAVVDRLGPQRTSAVRAIGLTGQMHGSVLLDSVGQVVRPALLWNDQRTAVETAWINTSIGMDQLLAWTGNVALTGFTAPKLLWLRRHEPDAYERVAKLLLPKDYIRYMLTGEYATDVADASGTLLFNVAERRWSTEMCDALEIPTEWLPDALEGPAVSGRLRAGIIGGLPVGIPVIAGGGDQAAGAVGVGAVLPGVVSVSIGTSGVVFAAADRPVHSPGGRLHSFCHSVPGTWHAMGVMLSAGGSLRWLRDAIYTPETTYEKLAAEADAIEPGAEGLIFAPYLAGERTPHADPDARGAFVGLGLRHGRAHMARAALEGIAFGLKDSLQLVKEMRMVPTELRITGGGARGAVWRRIMAAIFELPLQRMAVEEGPAFGAAVLAAVGVGVYMDVPSACAAMVKVGGQLEPVDPVLAERYSALYPIFQAAYPALRPLFQQLRLEPIETSIG